MNTSELIAPSHLARNALIYIRQSTPHQVISNQESLRLQYALKERALNLGWRADQIEIIDVDLGITGSSAKQREGFKSVVAQVTLGEVGIILSYEVTRLSRNCSDWFPLLDICAFTSCLIADRDGIYDPASVNGRLLLGLKGQISELELHTIKARMTAGLLNKAKRGELALALPTGLIRTAHGVVVKDPNLAVQSAIQLIFDTFARVKTATKVLTFLKSQNLVIPRQDKFGEIIWKKPAMTALVEILKNPAYAGTFAYGRTKTTRDASGKVKQTRLPLEKWRFIVHDVYPAYTTWETFMQNRATLAANIANHAHFHAPGTPKGGQALLSGLIYCGECGHKLRIEYSHGIRYVCNYAWRHFQEPTCQYIPGAPIDSQVTQAFFAAISPIELNILERTFAAQAAIAQRTQEAQQQQIERLKYAAQLARRQFDRVDPDNRLVAAELEKRWEAALRAVQAEKAVHKRTVQLELPVAQLSDELKTAFAAIGEQLPTLWEQEIIQPQHKQAAIRCLIEKVVVHRLQRDTVATRIVWRGGAITTFAVPIIVGSFAELTHAAEMEQQIITLSRQGLLDDVIADRLTQQGFRSPSTPYSVLENTVRNMRLKHQIFQPRKLSNPRKIVGYLTLRAIADHLGVCSNAIRYHMKKGRILVAKHPTLGLYLFPDAPDTLSQFRRFWDGELQHLDFSTEHHDA
jgi:DNA invertase Pin-like site-specific DNA recombinase